MRKKNTTTEILKDYMAQGLFILMRKKPFAAISIGEIVEKAGVNRSTYYRNFNSKDDIIKYFYNKITFEHLDRVKDKKDITMQDYLQKMFTHFYQYKKELLLIYKNKLSHLILDALNDTFMAVAEEQLFEEQFRIYYHTGGIYNCFLLWFSNEMNKSPEQMAELSFNILPKDFKPLLL